MVLVFSGDDQGREHRVVLVVFVRPSSDKIVAEIHARKDF